MNDICPYLCSFKSNSGYCNRTGGYDSCQYRKILGYDYEAKRFYVESVGSYEEAHGLRPMTNADRIRQMSDEELAKFIPGKSMWNCPPDIKNRGGCPGKCVPCWLEWLRKEADE